MATKKRDESGIEILASSVKMIPIEALAPHPQNPRRGHIPSIEESMRINGVFGVLVVQKSTGHVLCGNHRYYAARNLGVYSLPCQLVDVDDEHAQRIMLADNRTSDFADYDDEALRTLLVGLVDSSQGLEGTGFTPEDAAQIEDAAALLDALPTPARAPTPHTAPKDYAYSTQASERAGANRGIVIETPTPPPAVPVEERVKEAPDFIAEVAPKLTKDDIPSTLWPTDNPWDIPTLDLSMQATKIDLPVVTYGVMHKPKECGLLVFYTDDWRFKAVWDNPQRIPNMHPVSAVEPNFSMTTESPAAVVLYNVYRKRWLARWWQSLGIRIFVDLNVAHLWVDYNMLGVPKGWRSYCIRSFSTIDSASWLDEMFARACTHAQTKDVLFWVYGGSGTTEEICKSRGWIWVPEAVAVVRGNVKPFGDHYGWLRDGDDSVSDGREYVTRGKAAPDTV